MQHIAPENQLMVFDVDRTLVLEIHVGSKEAELPEFPGTEGTIWIEYGKSWVIPHTRHVAALKRHAVQGYTIIVWSRSGIAWAEKVVKALGLEDVVDYVAPKPLFYYDDQPATGWMDRIYITEDGFEHYDNDPSYFKKGEK